MNSRLCFVTGSLAIFASLALSACGGDSGSAAPAAGAGGAAADAASDADGGSAGTGGTGGTGGTVNEAGADAPPDAPPDAPNDTAETDGGSTCGRVLGPADADRYVVVSHPYDSTGAKAKTYELLQLSAAGALSSTGKTFEMGRSIMGDAVFTPDGEIGIVSQDEDGTLGVFKIDSTGTPQVVDAAFKGSFYAERLVMDPSGDRVYVLDSEWADIGGGVYSVRIGCDGKLTDEGRIIEAKLPYAMMLLPQAAGQAVIAAKDLLGSAAGDDAHLVTLQPQIARVASVDAFTDDEQIISSATVTSDGKYVLLGDNAVYSSQPNRVAVVQIDGSTLTYRQMLTTTLTDTLDPMAIVASPFGGTAIVVSGYGDAIFVLDYDPSNTTTPFSVRGELPYQGQNPQLPAGAVMIERGQLRGRVLVSENTAVRMVQFSSQAAGVTDLGPWDLGAGLEAIPGVVGVQP